MPFPKNNYLKKEFCNACYKTVTYKRKNGKFDVKTLRFEDVKALPSASLFDLTAVIDSGNDAQLKPVNTIIKDNHVSIDYTETQTEESNN